MYDGSIKLANMEILGLFSKSAVFDTSCIKTKQIYVAQGPFLGHSVHIMAMTIKMVCKWKGLAGLHI